MTDAEVLTIVTDALAVAARVSAPLLLTALVVGVVVSLFQAVTQVQEMTLTFVPKLIAMAVVLVVGGSWMMRELVAWVQRLWGEMGGMV